MNTISEFQ